MTPTQIKAAVAAWEAVWELIRATDSVRDMARYDRLTNADQQRFATADHAWTVARQIARSS